MQYSFEIWAQEGGKGSQWSVARRGSPGNFEDDDEPNAQEAQQMVSLMTAVQLGSSGQGCIAVGLAFVDPLGLLVGMHEWIEDDAASLCGVEAALVQLGARECLVSQQTLQQYPQLRTMLARADVVMTERKGAEFKGDVEQDLRRLLQPTHVPQLGSVEGQLCRAALTAVLKELEVLSETKSHGRYKLEPFQLRHCMRLDAAAVRALNLMPSATDGARSVSNVFGRLNATKTPMGARKLLAWLRAPLLDTKLIECRHNCVASLVSDTATRDELRRTALRTMPDVQRLLARFSRGKATLQDVLKLYQAVQALPAILKLLQDGTAEALKQIYLEPLTQIAAQFTNLCNMVESTLDLEAILDGHYRIKASFDEALEELEKNMAVAMRTMKAELSEATKVCSRAELEQRKDVGWCIKVAKKDAKLINDKVRGVEEVASHKNSHYFSTSKLRKASETHTTLSREYDSVQAALVVQLLDVVRGYAPLMEELQNVISDLDVYASLAHVAATAATPWIRPQVTPCGQGDTVLTGMRHPCLEQQDGLRYVANDVRFVRGERELIIITGPNMGGKSTHIRTAALCVLLAQVGSFVPCRGAAQVSVADALLCRVGAGDSLVRGVSTFMAEMSETAHLLRVATQASLLIVDELGRGTSTYDGFGLAFAIAEHIASKVHCFCFFATHFHELTHLAHRVPVVANQHVAAQTAQDELVLLYEVREGPCDQSFGIHVAELAKFPPRVVAMARRKAQQLESFDVVSKRQRLVVAGDVDDHANVEAMDLGEEDNNQAGRQEGELQIVHFLEGVKAAGPNMERLEQLRAELFSTGNAYVQSILRKGTASKNSPSAAGHDLAKD